MQDLQLEQKHVEELLKRLENKLPGHWKLVIGILITAFVLYGAHVYVAIQMDKAALRARIEEHERNEHQRDAGEQVRAKDNQRLDQVASSARTDATEEMADLRRELEALKRKKDPQKQVAAANQQMGIDAQLAQPGEKSQLTPADAEKAATFSFEHRILEADLKACKVEIQSCVTQRANDATTIAEQKQTIAEKTKDVKDLQASAKGGPWFKRLGRTARDLSMGAAIGILLKAVMH